MPYTIGRWVANDEKKSGFAAPPGISNNHANIGGVRFMQKKRDYVPIKDATSREIHTKEMYDWAHGQRDLFYPYFRERLSGPVSEQGNEEPALGHT